MSRSPRDQKRQGDPHDFVRERLADIILPSPRQIADELKRLGYHGQEEAQQAMTLMAYRHVRRLKRLYVDLTPRASLPLKQNMLLCGPTGSGKTFLVELLFEQILELPTILVDGTSFTESGYVGDNARTILTRLLEKAEGNVALASCGVVCIDEFDKLAASTSNARFAGQGTTKDVSGYGVQRELLAMLHGADVMVPLDYGFSEFGPRADFSTRDVPFIACGAFQGLDELLTEDKSIGFLPEDKREPLSLTTNQAASFQRYGFLPELIGRFSRMVMFEPLSQKTLKELVTHNILPPFVEEFSSEGLTLHVTDAALNLVAHKAYKRGAGARGLNTEVVSLLEHTAFNLFGQTNEAHVTVRAKQGDLAVEVTAKA